MGFSMIFISSYKCKQMHDQQEYLAILATGKCASWVASSSHLNSIWKCIMCIIWSKRAFPCFDTTHCTAQKLIHHWMLLDFHPRKTSLILIVHIIWEVNLHTSRLNSSSKIKQDTSADGKAAILQHEKIKSNNPIITSE